MARKKHPPIASEDRRVVGALLRDLRRGAGFRSVEAAAGTAGCPASRPTIYAYERGGLTPSLAQFLELAEFFVLKAQPGPDARPPAHQRAAGVAAVAKALELPAYHVAAAHELMARMQPNLGRTQP
jgi:transcriptional regulator with XRE-family HTH domain